MATTPAMHARLQEQEERRKVRNERLAALIQSVSTSEKLEQATGRFLSDILLEQWADLDMLSPQSDLLGELMCRVEELDAARAVVATARTLAGSGRPADEMASLAEALKQHDATVKAIRDGEPRPS